MKTSTSKIWIKSELCFRLFLTWFLYVVFGTGAVLVSFLLILPVVAFSRDKKKRIKRVRWLNRQAFRSFTRAGMLIGIFDVTFEDDERLDVPGQLVIANHPSLLDVVFLLGRIPNANCVVKKGLLKNPFLAMQVYFANYILNDAGETLLENCVNCLERGETVIIFPEGTRTRKEKGYVFKRGAAYLMLMANCTIRPIHISCLPPAFGKTDPWYFVPESKVCYRMSVLPDLDLDVIRQNSAMGMPLKCRRLTKWLTVFYQRLDNLSCNDALEGMDPVSTILTQKITA